MTSNDSDAGNGQSTTTASSAATGGKWPWWGQLILAVFAKIMTQATKDQIQSEVKKHMDELLKIRMEEVSRRMEARSDASDKLMEMRIAAIDERLKERFADADARITGRVADAYAQVTQDHQAGGGRRRADHLNH